MANPYVLSPAEADLPYEDLLWANPLGMTDSQLRSRMKSTCRAHRELRRRIYIRDYFTCQLCGYRPERIPSDYTGERTVGDLCVDHIFPRLQGGLTTSRNLRTLCWPCNFKRGDKRDLDYPPTRAICAPHECPRHGEVYTFGPNPVCPVRVSRAANCGEFVYRHAERAA